MTTPQLSSRRNFLRKGCLTAAAAGVVVCGGGAAALSYRPRVDFPSASYGEQGGAGRVLVAYASKAGSTAEVAAKIGETLSKKSLAVDVLSVTKVTSLSPYRAVILGSAIRVGKLLPEAMKFIQDNQVALQKIPFSPFIVCMTLKDDTPANRQEVSAYLDPVRTLVKPASEGMFAGAVISSRLTLFERIMMVAMKVPEGDYRKWDLIDAWTGQVVVR